MKRIFSILFISVLLICALGMTSCELINGTTTTPGPHVHVFTDKVVAPTCAEEGYTEHLCSECGYVMQDTFINPDSNAHEYVVVDRLDPTCNADGYEKTACKHCGIDGEEEIFEKEHNLGSWQVAVEPTCTTIGKERSYCSVCTWYDERDIAPAHNYEHLVVVTEPTCSTDGYTTYTCYDCGHSYKDDYITAFGHDWIPDLDMINGDEWVTVIEGDCTRYGEEMRQCATCDFIEKRYTDYAHDYEQLVTEPTCTVQGYTTHSCVLCGHKFLSDFVDPAHTLGNWNVHLAPSCKQEGLERRACEIEGCEYFEERKMAPQHTYDNVLVVPETKYTSGYTEHSCDCGLFYRDNYVSATGSEGLEYKLHKYWNAETLRYDVYYEVVGIGSCEDTEIAIPFEYEGVPVRIIGYQAFRDNDDITKVYLTKNITKISVSAFWYCDNLVEFHYDGKVAEWNGIEKGDAWNTGIPSHEVICADDKIIVVVPVEDNEELE